MTCLISIVCSSLNITVVGAAERTVVASTIVVGIKSTVTGMNLRVKKKLISFDLFFPFVGSRLSAGPKSFFSFPSFSYGYQNRACFDIL
jgi:hypothetical protein